MDELLQGLPARALLAVEEVAAHCRVNQSSVYRWIEERKLHAIKIGGTLRIPRMALQEALSPRAKPVRAHYKYTDEDLLRVLKELARQLGRVPGWRDLGRAKAGPSAWCYFHRWGSWCRALAAAGLTPTRLTTSEARPLTGRP